MICLLNLGPRDPDLAAWSDLYSEGLHDQEASIMCNAICMCHGSPLDRTVGVIYEMTQLKLDMDNCLCFGAP